MADMNQFVTDLRFDSPDTELGNLTVLVKQVNKSFAHGHWDGTEKRKADALIDEMNGKDIKEARKLLNDERARLAGLIKALDNTAQYMDDYLRPETPRVTRDTDDLDY